MAILNRRSVLLGGTAVAIVGATPFAAQFLGAAFGQEGSAVPGTFEVTNTDDEWMKILGPDAFNIMRRQGTEQPGSSPLLNEHRVGIFACAGCDLPLYDSTTKFDSGTGWPSFWQALPNAVVTMNDTSLGMDRDECHCRRCGGHLGHLFHDVPDQPINNRYCMDGLALKFEPKAA